jgi:hypothetical protein
MKYRSPSVCEICGKSRNSKNVDHSACAEKRKLLHASGTKTHKREQGYANPRILDGFLKSVGE